jgi:hypothetical protein
VKSLRSTFGNQLVVGDEPQDAVVEVLCVLDELLGFEVPEDVVRAGGYETIAEAIGDVMPRIASRWRKRNGGGA